MGSGGSGGAAVAASEAANDVADHDSNSGDDKPTTDAGLSSSATLSGLWDGDEDGAADLNDLDAFAHIFDDVVLDDVALHDIAGKHDGAAPASTPALSMAARPALRRLQAFLIESDDNAQDHKACVV